MYDEFYYRPKFNPFFRSLCMKFEGEGDGDGGSNQGGGNGEHWTDNYESTKGNAVLRRFKTEEDSHKGHLETKTALGDPLRLPKSLGKATDEQVVDYRARVGKLLGAPDTEDGYEITRPKLPDDMPYDEDGEKLVRAWGVKHHLPQAAVQEALNLWNEKMIGQSEAQAKTNEEAVETTSKQLKELWKDKHDDNVVLIERLLRGYVNPDWKNIKEEDDKDWQDFKKQVYLTGVGNNFAIMKILGDSAKFLISEGKVFGGTQSIEEKKQEDMSEKEKQEAFFPKSPEMVK